MTLQTVPLLGHAPDLDPAEKGAFSYCLGVEPTLRGWKLQRAKTSIATTSGANWTSGSYLLDGAVLAPTSGSPVVTNLAIYDAGASKVKLYVDVSGTLTNKSRATNYTATDNVSFCQYGNLTIATNLTDVLQIRDMTTANVFADSAATGIPKAKIAVTYGPVSGQRVMLLHYNDGTEYSDGWWTSHQGGPALAWTPDLATGAANGRLLSAGVIRAAIAYGDGIIVFSATTMYRGEFVGPPIMVEWHHVADGEGCIGQYACTIINGVLYWVGRDGLFSYDGGSVRRVEVPIQSAIKDRLGNGNDNRLLQLVRWSSSSRTERAMIAMKSNSYVASQAITTWYSVSIVQGKVGVLSPIATGSTPYQLCLPNNVGAYLVTGGEAVITQEQTTPHAASLNDLFGFGLSYLGSDHAQTQLRSVIPRFVTAPSSYKCTDYYGPTSAQALSVTLAGSTISATPWRTNFAHAARWHAPRFHFSSDGTVDTEVQDVLLDTVPVGAA